MRRRWPSATRRSPSSGAHAEQELELVLGSPRPRSARIAGATVARATRRGSRSPRSSRRRGGLQRLHEAGPHLVVVAELDRLGLDVDALAEPDARARELRRVGDRPPERGLEHRADAGGLGAELAAEAERVVRRRRVLHVDPHEAVRRLGRRDHRLDVALAEVVAELQAEGGRLDADVRIEPLALEGVERRDVFGRDRRGFEASMTSSPSTSTVASLPSAFRAATTRRASSSEEPAM